VKDAVLADNPTPSRTTLSQRDNGTGVGDDARVLPGTTAEEEGRGFVCRTEESSRIATAEEIATTLIPKKLNNARLARRTKLLEPTGSCSVSSGKLRNELPFLNIRLARDSAAESRV
jgi:hypothetical protein